jgi:hypothetical protein
MLTRTAIYEGKIKPGQVEIFFDRVRTELEPIWARFPHVTAVRVQRVQSSDKDARPIAMILEMDFPDMAAIEDCLASSGRWRTQKRKRLCSFSTAGFIISCLQRARWK